MQKYKLHNASQRRQKRKFSHAFVRLIKNFIALTVLVLIGFFLFPENLSEDINNITSSVTKSFDFRIQYIEVAGVEKLSQEEIIKLSKVRLNSSLLELNLGEVKNNLHNNTWIHSIVVSRVFPDKIKLTIVEEKPAAIYLHTNKKLLISSQGKILETLPIGFDTTGFILVKGEAANYEFNKVLEQIYKFHMINKSIMILEKKSNRRWNLELDNNLKIMLPEKNWENALKFVNNVLEENNFNFASLIDLRLLPDKMFVKKLEQYKK